MALKRYKVLWPHVGDKEYAVGDERVAEESAVAHLVAPASGMLELLGDAPEQPQPVPEVDKDQLIEMLKRERDEALAQLASVSQERDEAVSRATAQEHPASTETVAAPEKPAPTHRARRST